VLALPSFPEKGNRLLPNVENMRNTTARPKPARRFGTVITGFGSVITRSGMVITHSGNVISRFGKSRK
jgi:hypothetical protein